LFFFQRTINSACPGAQGIVVRSPPPACNSRAAGDENYLRSGAAADKETTLE